MPGPASGIEGLEERENGRADLDAERLRFVEDVALLLEREGLPRMAGRILGWLLVCEPSEQTTADLVRVLHASKGSVSTMTNLLERAQLIERLGRPGQRRDYFRVRPGSWSAILRDGTRRIVAMREVMGRGLEALAGCPPEVRARLQDAHDVLAFFEQEYPSLLARWEASRSPLAQAP
jgi:DNA-binding transcriptional regulator GbsR (MarR family)